MPDGLGRVLVVDDDPNNRDLLSRRLKRIGYEAEVARDGQDALDQIVDGMFDVVLLDVMMPGLDGFDVLRRIRETRPATDLPVIMATAKDDSEDVVLALGLGANDYVTKPLDFPVVAARVAIQVTLKRAVEQVRRLERNLGERNRDLEAANDRMSRDLRAAARIQESFLPRTAPEVAGLAFAWAFRPCDELAGDGLNAIRLDATRAAIYILDVSGHGVASSLLSVSLSRVLSPPTDASSILIRGGEGPDRLDPISPAEVAQRLNRLFPFELNTEQYSTLAYGFLDARTNVFRYTLAGHPGPIHLPLAGPATVLAGRGCPIGLSDSSRPFSDLAVTLSPGDRIYLYSDGIPEAINSRNEHYGMERFLKTLERGRLEPLCAAVNDLVAEVEAWSGSSGVRDDVSIVAVEVQADPSRTIDQLPEVRSASAAL